MSNVRCLALGLLVALGVAASQSAEATTYQVNGPFGDGGLLTGSFDFADGTLSNIDLTTSGGDFGSHYADGDYYSYSDKDYGDFQQFYFSNGNYHLELSVRSDTPDLSSLSWTSYEYINTTSSARSGSATLGQATPIVTPIPAALPLAASALAGLGGLGWVSRRRTDGDALAAA